MPRSQVHRSILRPTRRSRAVGSVLAFVTLLLASSPTAAAGQHTPTGNGQDLFLSISATTPTLEVGQSDVLTAEWEAARPLCYVSNLVFHWNLSLAATVVPGWLLATTGQATTFNATAAGNVSVDVTLVVDWICSNGQATEWAVSAIPLTVADSLTVTATRALPDPAAPYAPVTFTWNVSGGRSPYAENISFDDGQFLDTTQIAPGELSAIHAFLDGAYAPTLTVVDLLGARVTVPLTISLVVSPHLSVLAESTVPEAEPGTSVTFWASLSGELCPCTFEWVSEGNVVSTASEGTAVAPSGGHLVVSVTVQDLSGSFAYGRLDVPTVPDPQISVRAIHAAEDVGQPVAAILTIVGGVPPYSLHWVTTANGTVSLTEMSAPGNRTVSLSFPYPGLAPLSVVATDRQGISATDRANLATIGAPPLVFVSPLPLLVEASTSFHLTWGVIGGTAPYNWSLISTLPLLAGVSVGGVLTSNSTLSWIGSFSAPGTGTVSILVWDSVGSAVFWISTVEVVPPLAASLETPRGTVAGQLAMFELNISGGVGPFAYNISPSDGAGCNGTTPLTGVVGCGLVAPDPGPLTLRWTVRDALGGSLSAMTTILVMLQSNGGNGAGRPSAGTAGTWDLLAELGAVGAGIVIAGGAGALVWRRKRRSVDQRVPLAHALDVVRGVVRGRPDGIDEDSLLLLSEDNGIPVALAERAIEEWTRQHRLGTADDSVLGRVYRWKEVVEPEPPRSDSTAAQSES